MKSSRLPEPADGEDRFQKAQFLMEKVFGFRNFRPGQEEILEAFLSGEDTLVIMPTGGGKSLCYQLPALVLPGVSLVVSPLIALMKDQVDTLRVRELPAISIHSLMGLGEQEEALREIAAGAYKLIYVSPERLRNGPFMSALKKQAVSLVAVDEAHCISEWGHDFRPDYLRIGQALDWLGRPQTIALTATATAKVREDIISQLKLRAPKQFITGFDRENLFWDVSPLGSAKEKMDLLVRRLSKFSGGVIVYTGTRKNVESIVGHLMDQGIYAEGYHAGMEEEERSRVQEDFLEGSLDLIVATNAFGMGIDRSDIRMVIHHQLPGSIESYYQESGRAGRDGERSECLLLFSPADRRLQEFFIEASYPAPEVILTVHQALLLRPEDPIWLTYREIGKLCQLPVPDMAVASALKILEEAGIIHRLHRYENRAELYLRVKPAAILHSLPKKFSAKANFLKRIGDHYTDEELMEGIQFLPEEMADKAGLSKEAFRRLMTDLEEKEEGTYIPPFRGRGLRLLSRLPSAELKIDFHKLKLRKAHQMEKLDQIMAYGTSAHCRRAFLLDYFGERVSSPDCGRCDLCQNRRKAPAASPEGMDPLLAVKILSGVARLKGRFGQSMAVKMLAGSKDSKIEQFLLSRLSTYGLLGEFRQGQIEKWIQELLAHGCLTQRRIVMGGKPYPVLLLTPWGREVMKGQEQLFLSPPPAETKIPVLPVQEEFREDVFEDLRKLRLQLARRESLPPYCIFHDRTLRQMAKALPDTPAKMMAIAGVGEITFRKYGRDFIALISSYTSRKKQPDMEVRP
ncbi:MAG: RecQ family ATP-dependent DNA helicase [Deltaproteobacteria bacterium]|nr:RecQ family ATP-dependent DNA helicase [Deltaproteobacteria bacterium]